MLLSNGVLPLSLSHRIAASASGSRICLDLGRLAWEELQLLVPISLCRQGLFILANQIYVEQRSYIQVSDFFKESTKSFPKNIIYKELYIVKVCSFC